VASALKLAVGEGFLEVEDAVTVNVGVLEGDEVTEAVFDGA